LIANLERLRSIIEPQFRPDTASRQFRNRVPSSGHCAAVAAIVHVELGADLVSAMVDGVSHWFNRIRRGNETVDVDLTADQFGLPAIRIESAGSLYTDTRPRVLAELNEEWAHRGSPSHRRDPRAACEANRGTRTKLVVQRAC
jgi:hypothetical protein